MEAREKEKDLAANDTAQSLSELSMAEKEVLHEEDVMRRARANVAPLLFKSYTMCGELEYSAPEMLLGTGHGAFLVVFYLRNIPLS